MILSVKKISSTKGFNKSLLSAVLRIYPLLLIGILGLIIYSNTFNSSFHLDDFRNITENRAIRDIHDVREIWDFLNRRFIGYYTFAMNYHFHRLDVHGYHAVNLLIHIGASMFAFWLALLILSTPAMQKEEISTHKRLVALGCGLIFVSHPVQTQAVTYIVQRFASLAALFYLASLCFYLKARLTEGSYVRTFSFATSGLMALLGIFTKEIVFTLPLIVLLCEIFFLDTEESGVIALFKSKKFWLSALPFLLFLLILPALLSFKVSHVLGTVQSQRHLDPLLTPTIYIMTQFRVLVVYIRLLFLPVHQNLEYDFPASQSFFELPTLLGFIFLAAVFFSAIRMFSRHRFVSFGILWFFITLSVESIKPLGNVIFEHRLYVPMFGFSLVFAGALYRIFRRKHAGAVLLCFLAVIICYSFMTYKRNKAWKDEITLWTDVIRKSPGKTRPYLSLGQALYYKGKLDGAKRLFLRALEINPENSEAYNNLGLVYHRDGNLEEAIAHYRKALKFNPYNVEMYNNLGNVLRSRGEIEEAVKAFTRALEINPNSAETYNNLGFTLYSEGKVEEAVAEYQRALKIDPGIALIYNNLGTALGRLGKTEESKKQYYNALRIDPGNAEAHYNLGNVYYSEKNAEEAVKHFRKSLAFNPFLTGSYLNLGNIFLIQGKAQEAVQEYYRALDIDSDNADVHKNLGLALDEMGSYDKAIEHLKKALEIDETFETHYLLGTVLKKQGKVGEAQVHFDKAKKLREKSSP
jgi:protein O-mannosyl-transferase